MDSAAKRKALILGVSGQDGAYLARLLLEKGYEVHGTSRDRETNRFSGLRSLNVLERVVLHSALPTDFRSLMWVLNKISPDEIYNLSGQSSVGLSFEQPVEAFESIAVATINILECIRLLGYPIKLFSAASSECFGNTAEPANETTPFQPRSPYAMAKAAAFWTVANYRDAYGMFASSGILFNHESPLRPERFVVQKIVTGAVDIAMGRASRLKLGNINIARDWGWAPDYVEAIWRMMQIPSAADFVIATGKTHSLTELIDKAFQAVDLDWKQFVEFDDRLSRPAELDRSLADPRKARAVLGWEAQVDIDELIQRMIAAKKERAFL